VSTSRGRYLSELRRSGAAGIHDARPSRSLMRRLAIQEELDMSVIFDGDYIPEDDWEDAEPSLEELDEIDHEDYTPDDDRELPYDPEEYDYHGYGASNYYDE